MIRWHTKLMDFDIDPKAPVQRRREFATEKAKLEALRMMAECLDELTEAMYGHPDASQLDWQHIVPLEDEMASAQVEAMRRIATEIRDLKVAMVDSFKEKDVSGTAPPEGGTSVKLDRGGNLFFKGARDHGEPLYDPGRSPRLPPVGEGTIAKAIADGFAALAGTVRAEMERGQFPDGERPK